LASIQNPSIIGGYDGMTPEEIIRRCDEQIAISGETASVGFRIPGRWGKTNTRRLWKGGPVGEIVNDFGDGTIYVMFSAVEVKNAVLKEIGVTVDV